MRSLFILTLFFSAWAANAQSFHNNGAVVTITPNTIFTVRDSLVNNGTLTNNGNMVIGGVWLNLGVYNPGNGEITFNNAAGAASQIINHNSQSFSKLTISGGGEKLILADMTIVGELNLANGIIANQNNAKVIFEQGAVITGGSDQSHISGPVEQRGSGSLFFPIGNGLVYLPVEITEVGDPNVKAVLNLHELNSGEVLTGVAGITGLSTKRYWELNVSEGTLNGSSITLPLKGEEIPGGNTLLAVGESDNNLSGYSSIGQSTLSGDQSEGRITSEGQLDKTFFTVVSLSAEKNIMAYNGVSPNGDGLNDYFQILNIELYPKNRVTIYNRWGDKVFDISGYDNAQKAFIGENNLNGNTKLPSGIYFYKIALGDGTKELTGYLELKNEPN